MNRAWGFGIVCLFVAAGCRMTNVEPEGPVQEEPPFPAKEAPGKEAPDKEAPVPVAPPRKTLPPGRFSRNRLLEFNIPRERTSGQKGVELWYNPDGEIWSRGKFFEAGRETAGFFAPRDGRYEVVFVPMDHAGIPAYTPARATCPDYVVTVDSREPQVEILRPNGGEMFGTGRTVLIQWRAEDPNMAPAGVRVEVKPLDGLWTTVGKGLSNSGSFPWDVPRAADARYFVRVTATDLAGNIGADESDKSFAVDGLAPTARVIGPAESGVTPVPIEYEVNDLGGAGIGEVLLYFTRDDGETWEYYGKDDDGKSPILFQDLDDEYGFYIVAVDRVGNRSPAPKGGTGSQQEMIVDSTPPRMEFTSPQPRAYLTGRAIEVRWALRDNIGLPENPVRLDYSADGGETWIKIREKVAKDSPFPWSPPAEEGDRYLLRATVEDLAGNRTVALSPLFAVDTKVPEARVTGPARSRKSVSLVEYEILNLGCSPLKSVELWYSPDNGAHWHRWGGDPDMLSPLTFAKDDGTYSVYVTCESEAGARAGRIQRPPVDGTRPDFTFNIEIDSTPPVFELVEFPARTLYSAGETVSVRWREGTPKELHPVTTGLELLYSGDDGENWTPVAEKLDPASSLHEWTLPAGMDEKSVLLRLVSRDEFGNRGMAQSEIPFEVDGTSPTVTSTWARGQELRSLPKKVTATYKAFDEQSGLRTVQLWGKPKDGVAYELLKENAAPRGTISVKITEKGVWGFWLVAVDMAGNRSFDLLTDIPPDFQARIGFPPKRELELLSFSGGGRPYRGGADLLIALQTNIPLSLLRGKISADSGKSWKEIPTKNLEPVRGGLLWHDLPGESGEHYRLMIYSREGEVRSNRDFSIDATAPRAIVTGPEGPVEKSTVKLETKLKPSLSLIVTRTLWVTKDGGKNWSIFQVYRNPEDEIVFTTPDEGLHGFRLTAASRVGLSAPNPAPGTKPQHSIRMGRKKPESFTGKVSLTTTPLPVLKGGAREKISWEGTSNDSGATVTIYFRCDGSDIVIMEGLPLSGEHEWLVPKQSSAKCEIRVSVKVSGVPRWGNPTASFAIDDSPPRVVGSEIVEE